MTAYLRIAAVIAIVAVAGAAALYAFGAGPNLGTGPTPSTNTEPTTAQPTPAASASPIDTAGWVTIVSDRYGFSIGHPAGWTEMPAERSWTLEEDAEGAADDWLSPEPTPSWVITSALARGQCRLIATPRPRRWPGSRPGSPTTANGRAARPARESSIAPPGCAWRSEIATPASWFSSHPRPWPSSPEASTATP